VYHVLNRTVARHALFEKDGDYAAFERVMAEALDKHPIRVLAYCLMPNHWHLVLWPAEDGQLTAFTRWLTHTHTMRWHAHFHTSGTGHLYQGRFKSFPIEADEHLYRVLRYVERNALRANLVTQAELWRWSSQYLRLRDPVRATAWLTDWPVTMPSDWNQWVQEPQTESELKAIRRAVVRGCPYGTPRWQERTAHRLGLEATLRPVGRPRKKEDAPALALEPLSAN
jgi:putative transposase